MDKKIRTSKSFKSAFQISVAYLLFGMFWIYFSDMCIGFLTKDSDKILILQTYKGFFFIGVTAFLLYLLSYRTLQERHSEYLKYVNDQQIVQIQLSQQNSLLNSLINSSPDAIVIKGLDRRYIIFNKGASEFSGVETYDALGKTADEIFPPQTAHIINTIDNALIENNSFIAHEEIMLMPNGKTYVYWVTKGLLMTEDNSIFGIYGIYRNITSMKDHEQLIVDEKERYDYMAHHDPLTGLPNRLSLIETLRIKTEHMEDHPFALFFIDLDGFKEINDSYGHRFGDQILVLFAKLLQDLFPKNTLIIRTGGDEFVILLESKIDQHSIQIRLNRLIQALNDPFNIDQIEVYITASIGISLYPVDSSNAEELLQKADAAMYKAKNQGRNTYSFYNDGLTQEVLERTTLASNLKKAISNRDLSLYYQPQINPISGMMVGAEALLRWPTPEGMVPPSLFIPIAEERGLIIELGAFVLEEGFKMATEWVQNGMLKGRIAINVSAKQLIHQNFLLQLDELLHKTGCNPAWIELEITESSILEYPEKIIALLGVIKSKGFKISIDDFGTGYSSLSYLKHLPIDKLKIDISFIRDITMEPKNQTIVKTIIALAKGLGMTTVAEGVESVEEMVFLRECGVDCIQGFYYYKPMSNESFGHLIREI
ncbi:MAG: EAL domain-containing protein [Sulfuricurvum sp.]|uniref:sensor domain-containing protein n=1 Tax=Sulfuricurvum sp. TaxID=2025608 RepID=UPI002732FFC3|nr:EAL domain-containing protein [Sulfuricurvum sp.]MDP3291679.1 EAL domain-containing protein [Sulfuricurvum sp.]